jgi:hypothetical protein
VLGAVAAVGGLRPSTAVAEVPALTLLTRDTYAGLAVFGVPGPDRYSRAQGLVSPTPGGVEARSPELIQHTMDFFVPWPEVYVHALTEAFVAGAGLPLPGGGTPSVSLALALLLNLAATQVRATSVVGPIAGSPFANLSHGEKSRACQRIEQAYPGLVSLIDAHLPEPLNESVSGLLRFAGGLLLTLSTYTAYTEFGVFDRATRTVTRRPVGWDTSGYMPGRTTPADGWAEFLGYYQGRRAVATAPEFGEG